MSDKRDVIMSAISISEARQGNHGPLIARVIAGQQLTADEREYIARLLEASDGKRGKAAIKQIENALIVQRVEEQITELGSTEAAVSKVMEERGVRRSKIFDILRKSKNEK